ncbi:MAG TPA: GYD domain-containing protein [Desulfatiglandales bacterium]|nr:GYD domain-containing protein [Desulfatiglandales bacterium]
MATYIMFGTYSQDSVKEISKKRTDQAIKLLRKNGGELKSGYGLLGKTDIVLIVELPDNEQAIKTSAGLSKLLGISFTTAPAVKLEDFDKIMEGV